ncbi:hypothetical protein OF83DRAFT_1180543 [Amylostereum chailletii]|nr:hypothetical protein OF83DRAFT_1180543 [Amylostereum chailletii]
MPKLFHLNNFSPSPIPCSVLPASSPKISVPRSESTRDHASLRGWDERRFEVKIHLEKLLLEPNQCVGIQRVYDDGRVYRRAFSGSEHSQDQALRILSMHGLDKEGKEALESKWKVAWTDGAKDRTTRRFLYQWYSIYNTCSIQNPDCS